ncbi:hypothetical protein [Pseudomonas sp. MF6747]|uniref:hypothetical protein n=1 Tax=Pseudomonas sp. MF6747 TaxID=2797527 RepID=UPI00190D609B|nr:hypothetical protein [Pseudomonas sp. MF6747]MBK3506474.1 hypothetical protein [Pseudomonas sp. MF6747]
METSEILIWTLSYISIALKCSGIFAWVLLIIFIWLKYSKKSQHKLLSSMPIKILRLLAHRGIIWLMLVSAAYMPLRYISPHGIYYISELKILLYSILVGTGLRLIIGHKGLGIPLGEGLIMTVDRAPKLPFKLSSYVISFHVDKDFPKKRRTITNQIAKTINTIKALDTRYDFILKSWMFSDRDSVDPTSTYYIRSRMYLLQSTLKTFLLFLLISLAVYAYSAYSDESYDFLKTVLALIIATIGATALSTAFIIHLTKRRTRAVCSTFNSVLPSNATRILARELARKTANCDYNFITPQPMPAFHIISFSLIETAVIKDCVGTETGFVLIRL